jgi:predicted GIY-YIG superfamily endonuclease
MAFWVYILRCADGSYYVGHTDNLDFRLAQHQSGEVQGYTKSRRPVRLVYHESFTTRDDAFAAERQLKGWSRKKKEALIAADWEQLRLLAQRGSPCA